MKKNHLIFCLCWICPWTIILGDRCLLEMNDEDHKRVSQIVLCIMIIGITFDHKLAFYALQSRPQGKQRCPENVETTYFRETQHEFDSNLASFHQDLITCLRSIPGENKQELVSENEIIHNVMLIMVAGYETSSVLITFMVRVLAKNPNIHAAFLKGKTASEFHSDWSYSYLSGFF